MKNKKNLIGILVVTILFLIITATIIILNNKNKQNIKVVVNEEPVVEEKLDANMVNETPTWNIVSEEDVIKEENNEKETKTENKSEITAKVSSTKTKDDKTTNKVTSTSKKTSKNKYYIKINIAANVVNIYKQDDNGNYTVPYKAMICSTGKATPKAGNVYTISDRGVWGMMVGNVWAQYYTRITGVILFHSVPYTKRNKSSLEYWEYDKLGTKASAGCIRLTVKDSKWIYDNCPAGTKVEFYSDSNPGPFGKPSAQKVSGEANNLRGWDPTDPDSSNPWKNVKIKNKEQTKTTTTNNPTDRKNTEESTKTTENNNDKKDNVNNVNESSSNVISNKDTNSTNNTDNTKEDEEKNKSDNTVDTTN